MRIAKRACDDSAERETEIILIIVIGDSATCLTKLRCHFYTITKQVVQ